METGQDLHIRDARPTEYAAARSITLAAYEQYALVMEPDFWRDLQRAVTRALDTPGHAEWIIAERQGGIVGSVMLYPAHIDSYAGATAPTGYPELRLLAVAPAARGQGIGRLLVEECMRRARAGGASALGLHTNDTMQTARQMYERMGFRRVPVLDFSPAPDHLVKAYRLDLDPASATTHGAIPPPPIN
ncbi:MAG: GNAT family N-acetyltransferase [Herpetosiphon sp.]